MGVDCQFKGEGMCSSMLGINRGYKCSSTTSYFAIP